MQSIKFWATLVIVTISIITTTLFGFLFYKNLNSSLMAQYENKAEAILSQNSSELDNHISHVETILVQFAESFSIISDNGNRSQYIKQNLEEYQNMLMDEGNIIYYVDEREQYFGNEKELSNSYSYGKPPWYETAKKKPYEVVWLEPSLDESTGEVLIAAARTVHEKNGKKGVVAIEFPLKLINVSNSDIGNEGLIFLLNKDGIVLADNQDLMVGQSLFGKKFNVLMTQTKNEHVPFEIDGKTYYIHSKQIEKNGLNIVTAISESEINKILFESHFDILIVGVVTIIIFTVIVYVLTLWSVRPLKEIGKLMRAVEKGNYNVRAQENDYKEVSILANGFNNMLLAIKKRDMDLTISNNELKVAQNKLEIENKKLIESQRILKSSEAKVNYLASHDSLTGLLNRRSLMEKLATSLKDYNSQKLKVVIFLDLDNFKTINDTLGHSYGDLLLVEIAKKLVSIPFKEKDVARISGDEFILVLHDIESIAEAEKIGMSIVEYFESPIKIGSKSLNVTASIGIAIFPLHANNAEDLLKTADMAMYRAKKSGKKSYRIFDESIQKEVEEHLEIEQGIRNSLKNNDFELFFQPMYNTKENRVTNVETLLRTKSEVLSKHKISDIIFIAETTGQIIELDRWILKNACMSIQKINEQLDQPINVSVNMSAVHIMQQDFVENIISIIEESGVKPDLVELEITETSLMKSFETNNAKLEKLKEMGISIHLDDFGTGYSSLSYLNKLPIDHLKIDKSFIDSMLKTEKESRIVETIITLAHNIGFQVVAEGVEDEEQFNLLKQYQCELIQGYYISKPMRYEHLKNYLLSEKNIKSN